MAELDTIVDEISENVGTELKPEVETTIETAEIARLKAENAKQKAAIDKATKEAADYKKQLRAKQSAEEVAAEEAKVLQQSMQEELEQLRKEKAVAAITAKVIPMVGDSAISSQIAEYLYGAEDVDAALDAISKAWTTKEKALRLEFGKIQPPGVGSMDGPAMTKEDIMKIKDSAARQRAIAENIHLFTRG